MHSRGVSESGQWGGLRVFVQYLRVLCKLWYTVTVCLW